MTRMSLRKTDHEEAVKARIVEAFVCQIKSSGYRFFDLAVEMAES